MKPHLFCSVISAILLGFSFSTCAESEIDPIVGEDPNPDIELEQPKILSDQEKTALSLFGGIMDIVNARLDTSSCLELRGRYQLSIFANGMPGQRVQNNLATFKLQNQTFSVMGSPIRETTTVGSHILVETTRTLAPRSFFNPISTYQALFSFDKYNSMLTMFSNLELRNQLNNSLSTYSNRVISSFNRSSSETTQEDFATNIGWGMSYHLKSEYPTSKYWERLKIQRHNSNRSWIIYVRDLLTMRKNSECRFIIGTLGHNNTDFISQEGFLTIDVAKPGDPVFVSFD